MFAEWIIFGSMAFWVITAALSFLLAICIRTRREGFGIFAFAVFMAACFFAGDLRHTAAENIGMFLLCGAAYPAIGLLWSVPRWLLFLGELKRKYKEAVAVYLSRNGKSDRSLSEWISMVVLLQDAGVKYDSATKKITPPQFCDNKERIAGWVFLWPWSMLESLFGDILSRVCDWLVGLFRRGFQALSNWYFSDM